MAKLKAAVVAKLVKNSKKPEKTESWLEDQLGDEDKKILNRILTEPVVVAVIGKQFLEAYSNLIRLKNAGVIKKLHVLKGEGEYAFAFFWT